jgi:hypothetical protein
MREKEFQANVVELCKYLGYKVYHTFDSRRSEPGFPDLVIVGRNRCLFRELKSEKGDITSAQLTWGGALIAAGMDWDVWRPSEMDRIQKELSADAG